MCHSSMELCGVRVCGWLIRNPAELSSTAIAVRGEGASIQVSIQHCSVTALRKFTLQCCIYTTATVVRAEVRSGLQVNKALQCYSVTQVYSVIVLHKFTVLKCYTSLHCSVVYYSKLG